MTPEEKTQHLKFIQTSITKATNATMIAKIAMLILVVFLLIKSISAFTVTYGVIALIAILAAAAVDTYYCQQEKRLKGVYNDLVADKEFSMTSTLEKFDIEDLKNIKQYSNLLYIYLPIFIAALIFTIVWGIHIQIELSARAELLAPYLDTADEAFDILKGLMEEGLE